MIREICGRATAGMCLLFAASGVAEAGLVLEFGSAATGHAAFNQSAGFSFTTNQAVTVAALADLFPDASGSNVRLYDSTGTTLATVDVSSSDPTDGSPQAFHVHDLATPVELAANTTYYIAADFQIGDAADFLATELATDTAITYQGGVYSLGLGTNPTSDLLDGRTYPAYFGPNLEIGAPKAQPGPPKALSAAPEPSTLALAALALPVLWRAARRGIRRSPIAYGASDFVS